LGNPWSLAGLPASPLQTSPFLFILVWYYEEVWRRAWYFGKMGVLHSQILNLAPILERMKSSIPYEAWRFHFFPIFC
jgi:hypothetical protein